MHEAGTTVSVIAYHLGLIPNTVRNILSRYRKYGDVADRPRSGRPSKLSKIEKRRLITQCKKKPFSTVKEMWDAVKTTPSQREPHIRTVARVLLDHGFRSQRARHRPLLTTKHRERRLVFALEHKNYDWTNVVFSDEKRFALYSDKPRYVRRRRGDRERSNYTIDTVKYNGGSIMVWVAIRPDGRVYLRWCCDRMNSIDYQWMLESAIDEGLLSTTVEGKCHVFQQDNASVHTTARTTDFFHMRGLELLSWPAQSPDLNIVEHIWPMISRQLPKTGFRGREETWNAIEHAVRELESCAAFRALYESIPRRIQEVIDARGGGTS